MAEIDIKQVKWDDAPTAPAIDPKQVKWDDEQTPATPSAVDRAKRVAGLGVRAVATSLPPIGLGLALGEGINQAYQLATGEHRPSVFEGWNTFLTNAGLPEPSTRTERISSAVTGGMAGMGGQIGALQAVQTAPQTASRFIQELMTQQPGRQVVAGGTSALSGQAAAEAGAGPVGQMAASLAGGALPFLPQIATRPTPEAIRGRETTDAARSVGLRVPPQGPLTGYVAGKAPTDRSLSIKNQPTINTVAKNYLPGFDEQRPLTFSNLESYRSTQGQPYREVSGLSARARDAVQELRQTRKDASMYHRATTAPGGNPEAQIQARALDAQAGALETEIATIARNAGRPELIDRLREARTNIAKSYTVERALDEATGNVDARLIARMVDRGDPIGGQLRTVGKAAMMYPNAMRLPEAVGSPPGRDVLGTYLGLMSLGGAAATQNPYFLAPAALPLVRPLTRGVITSRPYQALMMGQQTAPLDPATAGALATMPALY